MSETITPPLAETHAFEADVNKVLDLVVHSLYSHREIFLRELISNASDALDKLKFETLTRHDLLADDVPLDIRISVDPKASTLTVEDTGIGMNRADLVRELGTIAHSGTRRFLERVKEQGGADEGALIGQFGVGFYSAFLVAHQVDVISRKAGDDGPAHRWSSRADGTFTIEPASRPVHGTTVILHLRDDASDYLDQYRLEHLIKKYSDFVSHPILLKRTTFGPEGEKTEWHQVNRGTALWLRPKDDISDEEYTEFYKHLTGDSEPPISRLHLHIEGTREFTALLFLPRRAPHDLFFADANLGIRLYVQRVFIMEDCKELLPSWLRFVRGVVESADLPLNVSRELLQDSRTARFIRKQLTKRILDHIEAMARERPEDFDTFWSTFGPVIKEGLHNDWENRDRLLKLVRFRSSHGDGWTTLAEVVERMPEDQDAIYYILGDNLDALKTSPHLEVLRERGYEVLYLTDPIDEWVATGIGSYEGKRLLSVMKADLGLSRPEGGDGAEPDLRPLLDRIKEVLIDRVQDVVFSTRLTDSPACLVVPEGSLHARTIRLLQQHTPELPEVKRILEVNPRHPIIEALRARLDRGDRETFDEWVELLYEQALLTEGSPLPNVNAFARRIHRLMERVADLEADTSQEVDQDA